MASKEQLTRMIIHNVSWDGGVADRVYVPTEYAALLDDAVGDNGESWLDYVTRAVDRIDFIPAHRLRLSDERICIGAASVVRGCRWEQVATLGRTAQDIAETIVHEAAHLASFHDTGRLCGESRAEETEDRFVRHLYEAYDDCDDDYYYYDDDDDYHDYDASSRREGSFRHVLRQWGRILTLSPKGS